MTLYLRMDSPKANPQTRIYAQAIYYGSSQRKNGKGGEKPEQGKKRSQVGC